MPGARLGSEYVPSTWVSTCAAAGLPGYWNAAAQMPPTAPLASLTVPDTLPGAAIAAAGSTSAVSTASEAQRRRSCIKSPPWVLGISYLCTRSGLGGRSQGRLDECSTSDGAQVRG